MDADFLNPSCTIDARLGSKLLGDPPQNPFSTVSHRFGHGHRRELAVRSSARASVSARAWARLPSDRAKGPSMRVLMVLTSHDQLGNTGRKTGFWLEELA